MNYNLKKPCKHCPFRTDCRKGWLGESRADEIADSLERQQSFPCHETTEFYEDGEAVQTPEEEHCAGAMILLQSLGIPNQMMRIAHRLGIFNPDELDMQSPVFETMEDFIDHHTED